MSSSTGGVDRLVVHDSPDAIQHGASSLPPASAKRNSRGAKPQDSMMALQQKTSNYFKNIVASQDSLVEMDMKIQNTTKAIKQRKDYMKAQSMSTTESLRMQSDKRNHNRRLENRREKTNQKLNKIHAANKQLMEQINNYRINNKGQLRGLEKLRKALRRKRKEIKIIMQTTKEAREQEDHMRREFANMKTKISSDLVESIEFIDNLKSDILTTKEESQKATSSIADALNASIAKNTGHTKMIQPATEDLSAALGTYVENGDVDLALVSADDPIPPWMTARTVVEVDDSEEREEQTRAELLRLKFETNVETLRELENEMLQAQDSEWEKFREVDRIKSDLQQSQDENAELRAEVKGCWDGMAESARDALLKKFRRDPAKATYIAQLFAAEKQQQLEQQRAQKHSREEVPATLESQMRSYEDMIDEQNTQYDRTEATIKEQQKQVLQTAEKLLEWFGKENDPEMVVVLDDIKSTGLNSGNLESAMGMMESLVAQYASLDSLAVTRRERTQALALDATGEDLNPNLKPRAVKEDGSSMPIITKPELPSAQETEDEAKKDDGMRRIQPYKSKRLYDLVRMSYGGEEPAAASSGGRAQRNSIMGKTSSRKVSVARQSPKVGQKNPEQVTGGATPGPSKRSFSFLAR